MENSANIEGNQNIVIQGVTDSTITLNVNGETQEINNKLDSLKVLLMDLFRDITSLKTGFIQGDMRSL